MHADQINSSTQIVRSIFGNTVDFNQLGHACPARCDRTCHDLNQLIRFNGGEPRHCGLFNMELHRCAVRIFAKLHRAPIFGHRDVGVIQIAGVKDDALRIGFGPTHAETIVESKVTARHVKSRSTG